MFLCRKLGLNYIWVGLNKAVIFKMHINILLLRKRWYSQIDIITPNATIIQTASNQDGIFSKSATFFIENIANNHGKIRSIEKDRELLRLLFNSIAAVKGLSSKREGLIFDYRIL